MNLRKRFSDAWWRLRYDETGAVCVDCGLEVVDGLLQVELDPAGGITCGAGGLVANFPAPPESVCPDAVTGLQQATNTVDPVTMPLAVSSGGGTFVWKSGVITISNPLDCEVSGTISIRAGGLYLEANDGFYGQAQLLVNPDGGGLVPAYPDTMMVFENQSGGVLHSAFNNLVDENLLVVPGAGSVTYQAAVEIGMFAGTGTVSGTIGFEFNWTLPQTGCC